ncbi:MAG: cell wall hydrolase [Agathobacter sp.]|nr:cell wall hydrolase [Agathobacter sp.]
MKLNLKFRLLSVLLALVLLLTACGTQPELEDSQVESTEDAEVSIEKEENNIVTSPLEEDTEKEVVIVQPTPEQLEKYQWSNYMMPKVNEFLNVRTEPKAEAALAGRLEKGDRAIAVERGAEWTKIKSGELVGYVKTEYCLFGDDALAYAKANCPTIATTLTGGLRIREKMSVDSAIVKSLEEGEKLVVDTAAVTEEGWIAVKHNNKTCYVSAEFVDVSMEIGTGITQAEIEAIAKAEAERKAKEEKAKKEAAEKVAASNAAVKEVDELTLMAALIYCEAGAEPYETQLAVGAVVMNRLKSSRYPNTLYDVIYQKGQFTPARNGKVARIIAQGKASESCYKAARAALAGEDNTNGCLRFNDYNGTQKGILYGGMIFW